MGNQRYYMHNLFQIDYINLFLLCRLLVVGRPSTKMSGSNFFVFFFLSPYPLSRSERLRLRTAIVLKRCCVILRRIRDTSVYEKFTGIFVPNIVWERVLKLYPAKYQIKVWIFFDHWKARNFS